MFTEKIIKPKDLLIPFRKKERWGYCDKDKNILIPCIYNSATRFKNGFAKVEKNDKYNIINERGEELFSYEFDSIDYSEGQFLGKLAGKYFFYDEAGKKITSKEFEDASNFKEGLAGIKLNGRWGFLDREGEVAIKCGYDGVDNFSTFKNYAIVWTDKTKWLVDRSGEYVKSFPYERYFSTEFSDGLILVKSAYRDTWGFINQNGDEKIPCVYDYAKKFSEGLASVACQNRWGFIDQNGTYIIPFNYQSAGSFSNGLCSCSLNGKMGFINNFGDSAIEFTYDIANSFSEGLAAVKIQRRWGYIDTLSNKIIENKYESASWFREGIAAILLNNKKGYIDKKGNVILKPIYSRVEDISIGTDFVNGLVLLHQDHSLKAGYADKDGVQYWED